LKGGIKEREGYKLSSSEKKEGGGIFGEGGLFERGG